MDEHLEEKRISGKQVFSGILLQVHCDQVQLPDGNTSVREWIDHPGAAAVVPVFDDGTTIMVKQYRYPVGRTFLEIPAGKCDVAGENPEDVARRELEEETGWKAGQLRSLGAFYPGIGYSNECIHFFLATELVQGVRMEGEGEFIDTHVMPLLQCLSMVENGEILDMKSALGLRLAADKIKNLKR